MLRRALLGALTAAFAVASSGCGGSAATTTTTTGKTAPAAETLFVQNCAACHRLAAANASGSVGADLDKVRPSEAAVLQAIADGPGNMPSGLLQGRDAQSVARYVARAAGRR